MFIYSIRAGSVKIIAVMIITVALLIGVMVSGDTVFASSDGVTEIDFNGIKTKEDRIAFIESFGARVNAESEESVSFVMPKSFDRVLFGYNEIQKAQGLDITKYAGKRVTRYTYQLIDYCDADAYVSVFVFRNRIIALDVSSADPEGFVRPLIEG